MGFCSSNQRRRRKNDFIVRLKLVGMYFHILRNRIQITGKYMIYFILKNLLSRLLPTIYKKEHKYICISSKQLLHIIFYSFQHFFYQQFRRKIYYVRIIIYYCYTWTMRIIKILILYILDINIKLCSFQQFFYQSNLLCI